MEIKIIQPCVNQDTGARCNPGDIITVGSMEFSRLIAGKYAVPVPADGVRNAMVIPIEKRRKRNAG